MARGQIGNNLGVAAVDPGPIVAEITADGINTVTVSAANARKLRVSQTIDIVNKSTGAVLASARTIDAITAAGVVTYSGTDEAAVPGTHAIYDSGDYTSYPPTGAFARKGYTNFNGGPGPGIGFAMNQALTIDEMRARLKVIAATTYTDAELDKMTYNDMIYALRVNDAAGSIK